jgi:hypothetical protein
MFPATVAGVVGLLLYSGGFFNGTGREAFYSKKRIPLYILKYSRLYAIYLGKWCVQQKALFSGARHGSVQLFDG